MNYLIAEKSDFISDDTVRIGGERLKHIVSVLGSSKGSLIKSALYNGMRGRGEIIEINENEALIKLELTEKPPQKLPLEIICALPRPKSFKKILHAAMTLGVRKIVFINSFKVEKSYWSSPLLEPEKIKNEIILAMSQSGDSLAPEISFEKLFKPFMEDKVPRLADSFDYKLAAHPNSTTACPASIAPASSLLFIGPEGGFTDYEISMIQSYAKAQTISLGSRIMRTEVAVPAVVGKLYL